MNYRGFTIPYLLIPVVDRREKLELKQRDRGKGNDPLRSTITRLKVGIIHTSHLVHITRLDSISRKVTSQRTEKRLMKS
jgi:hypothetical protein